MGVYAIVVSLIIIFGIFLFELVRIKKRKIDFLTGINLIFILAYGITPIFINYFYEYTTWHTIWHNDIKEIYFLYAILLAVLFYIIMVLIYYITGKFRFIHRVKRFSEDLFFNTKDNQFFKVAIILFILGGFSLIVYMRILGGFSEYIRLGPLIRSPNSNPISHPLMFLKNITPLIGVSALIFYALFIKKKGFQKLTNLIFFIISFSLGLLVVFHSSGRMTAVTCLITIPFAYIIFKNRVRLRFVIFGLVMFLFIALFGDQMMSGNDGRYESRGGIDSTVSLVQEFSFPYTNLANSIKIFPSEYSFRWGVPDMLRGFNEILPSSILSLELFKGETATELNTRIFSNTGALPIDIISFGYMSFGISGVIIIAMFFGFIVRVFESLFDYTGNLISCVFYVSWLIFLAFRIMYGEPGQAYISSFKYVVAIILILLLAKRKNEVIPVQRYLSN